MSRPNSIACIVCNSKNNSFSRVLPYSSNPRKTFNLLKCNDCDAAFLDDTKTDFNKSYPEDYYGHSDSKFFIAQKFFNILRARKLYFLPKISRILDFGCGNGSFLETMASKGFIVFGLEHSIQSKKIAEKKQLPIFFGSVSKLPTNQLFDAITLWQVLEHLNKPNKVLNELRKYLKNNGTIIISVVNRNSLQARMAKENWLHLDIPHHVGHYSVSSLRNLLEKNGFSIKRVSQFSLEYGPFGFAQSALNMLGMEKNIIYRNIKYCEKFPFHKLMMAFFLLPPLLLLGYFFEAIASVFGQGAVIEVIATKKYKSVFNNSI